MSKHRFGIVGVAGYIAPRHLDAIRATGNQLVVACDPRDSVGILDRFNLDTAFVASEARLASWLRRQRVGLGARGVDYVAICSPNHLHPKHCHLVLSEQADAICEKPLATTPAELDALEALEERTGRRVYTVLQLRFHERLLALRRRLADEPGRHHDVVLTYVTGRGPWYHASWKGDPEKSGGMAMNIGIHLFDLLLWLFGKVEHEAVELTDGQRMAGSLELERASVRWFLSLDPADAAPHVGPTGGVTHRSMLIDGERIDFSHGFSDLHAEVYRSILSGEGLGIAEARPSVELTHRLASAPVAGSGAHALALHRARSR
jgi:UDP-N-acetyl-2-amino-2-deoxyglucuronate dehydrogenase